MTIFRTLIVAALALLLNVAVATQSGHAASGPSFTGFLWHPYTAPGVHYTGPLQTTAVTTNQFIDFHPLYSINAYNAYCQGGGTSCVSGCPTDSYPCAPTFAAVFALGPAPGASYGTPGFVFMGCGVPQPNGGYLAGFVIAATPQFIQMQTGLMPIIPEVFTGVITGKGTLLTAQQAGDDPTTTPPGSESLTQSTSSLQASAYSGITGTVASVTGTQSTDNTMDQPNVSSTPSGFLITLNGYLYNSSTNSVQRGSISCRAGGPNALDVSNYFSGSPGFNPLEIAGAEGEFDYIPYFNFTNYIFPTG